MDCGVELPSRLGRPSPRCKQCRGKREAARLKIRGERRAGKVRWPEEVGDESDWEATWGASHRVGLPGGVSSMYSVFHNDRVSEMGLM